MPEPQNVQLGDHRYVVVPQRQARLKRQVPAVFDGVGTSDAASILDMLSDRAYDLLRVFIPDLMPKWEWDGYASEASAAEDIYDGDADRSPTHLQVQSALGVCMEVNGIDKFKLLGNVVSPEVLRALMSQQLLQMTMPSRSLPSPNGAPESTTTSPTSPTPEPPVSAAGPSPA